MSQNSVENLKSSTAANASKIMNQRPIITKPLQARTTFNSQMHSKRSSKTDLMIAKLVKTVQQTQVKPKKE